MGGDGGDGRQSQPKLIFYTNLIKTDVIIGVGSLPLPCQSQSDGQVAVITAETFLQENKFQIKLLVIFLHGLGLSNEFSMNNDN